MSEWSGGEEGGKRQGQGGKGSTDDNDERGEEARPRGGRGHR